VLPGKWCVYTAVYLGFALAQNAAQVMALVAASGPRERAAPP
jgi:hypothetical protein